VVAGRDCGIFEVRSRVGRSRWIRVSPSAARVCALRAFWSAMHAGEGRSCGDSRVECAHRHQGSIRRLCGSSSSRGHSVWRVRRVEDGNDVKRTGDEKEVKGREKKVFVGSGVRNDASKGAVAVPRTELCPGGEAGLGIADVSETQRAAQEGRMPFGVPESVEPRTTDEGGELLFQRFDLALDALELGNQARRRRRESCRPGSRGLRSHQMFRACCADESLCFHRD